MRSSLFLALALATPALAGDTVIRTPQQVDTTSLGVGLNPSVASDADLVAVSFFDGGSSGTSNVSVVTSDGRGVTWSAPVRVDADTTGAGKIANFDACGVFGDDVYVVWKDERLGSATDDVWFNRSTDGGASFAPINERLLDDGYGNTGVVRSWRSAYGRVPGGARYVYVLMASDGPNSNEELFLVVSSDGGDTFSAAKKVAGDGANWDIDSLAVAADGPICHIAWDSDETNPGSNLDSVYYRRYDAVSDTFGSQITLDLFTDGPDIGDSQFGSNYSFNVAAEGDLVAVCWLEERESASNEEVRVALSLNGGLSFQADKQVGGYDISLGHDVDFCDVAVQNGNVFVAYNDNRVSLGTLDDVYVSALIDPIGSFPTWQESGPLSGAEGGSAPRIRGGGDDVGVTWTSDASGNQYAGSAFSVDAGQTWTTDLRVSDDSGSFDMDIAELAYNAAYQNFVHAWLSNETGNTNNVFVGGYRPQTLTPTGWVAGNTTVAFEFENFVPQDTNSLGVVFWAFSLGTGQFPIGVNRDTGLAFDALSQFGLDFYPLLLTNIDGQGAGATPSLNITLPAGGSFHAVGVGFTGGAFSAMRISDPVFVQF